FHRWEIVPGTEGGSTAAGEVLHLAKNSNPYAFSFYGHRNKSIIKDVKDSLKETFKDLWKEKEILLDKSHAHDKIYTPEKLQSAETLPWRDQGDPAYLGKLQILTDKIASLEKQIAQIGQAFIKGEERPNVGGKLSNR